MTLTRICWKSKFFKSDIQEFAKQLPTEDLRRIVESMSGYGVLLPDEPEYFWSNHAESLTVALNVVKHRISRRHIQFTETASPSEYLVEAGQLHTGYGILRDIVESTESDIMLVDAWLDRVVFDLLSNLKAQTNIRFLTRSEYLPKDFVTEAKKFSQETKHDVAVRSHLDVHDRFIVTDGRTFQAGSSSKDLGKRSSLVIEIKDLAAATIDLIEARWNEGTVLL